VKVPILAKVAQSFWQRYTLVSKFAFPLSLYLLHLGVLDWCDCELAGRLVASEVGGDDSHSSNGVSWERFATILDVLATQRDEGHLGGAAVQVESS
jgi:hypothetical protein